MDEPKLEIRHGIGMMIEFGIESGEPFILEREE